LKVVEIETLYADFRAMAAGIAERSRYLRDFAASLSHEFKTPLTGITGAIELLEDHGATMEPAERQRFLTNMRGDADRLSRLVRRLMDLARADMAMPDGSAHCDGAATLASIADGYRGGGFDVQLSLGTPTAAPTPILLAIEGETLAAIATVLVENARQAGAQHLVIRSEILRMAGGGGGQVALHFTDDGAGIAPGDAARIFDTFFTSRREHGGTGLGLAIARSLAEANGGTLVLADAGQAAPTGATFTLTLPQT
jgi:signal transduction histidine kinase